jgi:hypothetical protein
MIEIHLRRARRKVCDASISFASADAKICDALCLFAVWERQMRRSYSFKSKKCGAYGAALSSFGEKFCKTLQIPPFRW